MPTGPIELDEGASGSKTLVGPITRITIARYAGAGGDFNPVHCDEQFAHAVGMPSVFSHGLLGAGALAQYLARWVGLANVRRFGVRFTGQVWPDDVLTLSGTVERVEESDGERLVHITLGASRQTGDVVLKGSAVARVA
jgi:acyl dehydratase